MGAGYIYWIKNGPESGDGMTSWERACAGKSVNASCDWYDKDKDILLTNKGKCSQSAFGSKHRYCNKGIGYT